MKTKLLTLSLLILTFSLVWAYPTNNSTRITNRGKVDTYSDSLILFSPARGTRPKDCPLLVLYCFKSKLSKNDQKAFASAIAANTHGAGKEYPYAILELLLNASKPFGPEGIEEFMVGGCSGPHSMGLRGARLQYPDPNDPWNTNFSTLSGELRDGGTIQYDLVVEQKPGRYKAEFHGSAPLMVVAKAKYEF